MRIGVVFPQTELGGDVGAVRAYGQGVEELEFVTGVIIVPQRQTALVAKQAAEVDLLTRGRFRLGVGIGWNAVEYEALGEDFKKLVARGPRSRSP